MYRRMVTQILGQSSTLSVEEYNSLWQAHQEIYGTMTSNLLITIQDCSTKKRNHPYYPEPLEVCHIHGSPKTTGTSLIRQNEIRNSKHLRNMPQPFKK